MGTYYDYILGCCQTAKPNEICCKTYHVTNKHKLFGTDRMQLLFELETLAANDIIRVDATFIVLTKKGYSYIHSGEDEALRIDFKILLGLSKNREDLFINLWSLIGPVGQAPYYIPGSVYFDAIAPILGLIGSYSRYMTKLKAEKDDIVKRIDWYEDLFNKLPEDAVEPFLEKLSVAFNKMSFEVTASFEESSIDISFPEFVSAESVNNKTIMNNMGKPNKIFISHSSKDEAIVKKLV